MSATSITHPQALSQLLDNLKIVIPSLESANLGLLATQLKESMEKVEVLAFPSPISVEDILSAAKAFELPITQDQAYASLKLLSDRLKDEPLSFVNDALLHDIIVKASDDGRRFYKANVADQNDPGTVKQILIEKSIVQGFIQIIRSEELENGKVINDDESLLGSAIFWAIERRNKRFDSGPVVAFLSLQPGLYDGFGREVAVA